MPPKVVIFLWKNSPEYGCTEPDEAERSRYTQMGDSTTMQASFLVEIERHGDLMTTNHYSVAWGI
jgi:hypothetical protein